LKITGYTIIAHYVRKRQWLIITINVYAEWSPKVESAISG